MQDVHQETWLIFYDDIRLGTIAERAGVPLDLEPIRKEVESAESFMIPCKARDSSRSALPCGQPNTAVRRTVADFAIRVI
jgi:hypothetical protein